MADDDNVKPIGGKQPSILDQARSKINKARRESAEAKIKDQLTKRDEHARAIKQIDLEIERILEELAELE